MEENENEGRGEEEEEEEEEEEDPKEEPFREPERRLFYFDPNNACDEEAMPKGETNPNEEDRQENENPHHVNQEAMEVDGLSTINEELVDDSLEWRNVYSPDHHNNSQEQALPTNPVEALTDQEQSEEALRDDVIANLYTRTREAVRKRRIYFRQFMEKRNRGSSSRNLGDAPSP